MMQVVCCEKPLSRNRVRLRARDRSFLFCISFSLLLVFFFFSLCARALARARVFAARIGDDYKQKLCIVSFLKGLKIHPNDAKQKRNEPKTSANARERVLFFSSSFFILYLFPTPREREKKRARALFVGSGILSLSVCVCGDDDVQIPLFEVSESRVDGNAMP